MAQPDAQPQPLGRLREIMIRGVRDEPRYYHIPATDDVLAWLRAVDDVPWHEYPAHFRRRPWVVDAQGRVTLGVTPGDARGVDCGTDVPGGGAV